MCWPLSAATLTFARCTVRPALVPRTVNRWCVCKSAASNGVSGCLPISSRSYHVNILFLHLSYAILRSNIFAAYFHCHSSRNLPFPLPHRARCRVTSTCPRCRRSRTCRRRGPTIFCSEVSCRRSLVCRPQRRPSSPRMHTLAHACRCAERDGRVGRWMMGRRERERRDVFFPCVIAMLLLD
jgi:hypothetical protein